MTVTYTEDRITPFSATDNVVSEENFVPIYARRGRTTRQGGGKIKTWMILAPVGALVIGGAAVAMLMYGDAAEEPVAAEPAASAALAPVLPAPPLASTPAPVEAAAPVVRDVAPVRAAPAPARRAAAPAPRIERPIARRVATPPGPAVVPAPIAPSPASPTAALNTAPTPAPALAPVPAQPPEPVIVVQPLG